MIVTCPGCNAKFRVRNDAVPEEGARLRCTSCDTLFLARLPPNTSPNAQDDPSALYQQLVPAGAAATAAPPRPAQPPVVIKPAVPQPAVPQPGGAEQPPVVAQALSTPSAKPAPSAGSNVPAPVLRGPPSAAMVLASWVTLGAGAAACGAALVFSLWATEVLPLDPLLMPAAERALGVEPPFSFVGRQDPTVDALRDEAGAEYARGDLAAALVLWQRVKLWAPNDPRAVVQIAKLRAELGDLRGSP